MWFRIVLRRAAAVREKAAVVCEKSFTAGAYNTRKGYKSLKRNIQIFKKQVAYCAAAVIINMNKTERRR